MLSAHSEMLEWGTHALSGPMCASPRQHHQCRSSSLISLGASKATLTTGSTVHCGARRPVSGHPQLPSSPSPHFPFSFLGRNFQMYPNVERVQYYPSHPPGPDPVQVPSIFPANSVPSLSLQQVLWSQYLQSV